MVEHGEMLQIILAVAEDTVYQVYRAVAQKKYLHKLSTNIFCAANSKGVAENKPLMHSGARHEIRR